MAINVYSMTTIYLLHLFAFVVISIPPNSANDDYTRDSITGDVRVDGRANGSVDFDLLLGLDKEFSKCEKQICNYVSVPFDDQNCSYPWDDRKVVEHTCPGETCASDSPWYEYKFCMGSTKFYSNGFSISRTRKAECTNGMIMCHNTRLPEDYSHEHIEWTTAEWFEKACGNDGYTKGLRVTVNESHFLMEASHHGLMNASYQPYELAPYAWIRTAEDCLVWTSRGYQMDSAGPFNQPVFSDSARGYDYFLRDQDRVCVPKDGKILKRKTRVVRGGSECDMIFTYYGIQTLPDSAKGVPLCSLMWKESMTCENPLNGYMPEVKWCTGKIVTGLGRDDGYAKRLSEYAQQTVDQLPSLTEEQKKAIVNGPLNQTVTNVTLEASVGEGVVMSVLFVYCGDFFAFNTSIVQFQRWKFPTRSDTTYSGGVILNGTATKNLSANETVFDSIGSLALPSTFLTSLALCAALTFVCI
ncbi:hypothetical protein Ddc_13358 [Ditylenchus destructor]|nr:hypothetical protein Ddc_13358 [Ditylenchus destructor]